MIRRRSSWLVGVLVCGALAAGCGSSSNSSKSSSPATTSTPAAAATSSTPASTSSAVPVGPATVQQAVASCKQAIQAQTTLTAAAKAKLEGMCAKAATGDTTALKKAAQEVCENIIKSSKVPAGAATEQALLACRSK